MLKGNNIKHEHHIYMHIDRMNELINLYFGCNLEL